VDGWVTNPGRPKEKGPGRLRGAGLFVLNPQPNCEGAGTLTLGQSRHPTVIHATAPGRRWERLGATGGASGGLTTLGIPQT
jgi:hypothetical protein